MILDAIFEIDHAPNSDVPFFNSEASAGEFVTTENTIDEIIDINEMLIEHPSSTFFAKISGDSGFDKIKKDDTLVIDTSIKPGSGQLVCVAKKDKISICRFLESDFGKFLETDTGDLDEISSIHSPENQVVGVVAKVIHHF